VTVKTICERLVHGWSGEGVEEKSKGCILYVQISLEVYSNGNLGHNPSFRILSGSLG